MAYLQKLRNFFATLTHRKPSAEPTGQTSQNANKNRQEAPAHTREPFEPQGHEDSDSDPYGALSEIAAPEPIERLSEAELARHPSLEQGYEIFRWDLYGALSEIAAPEPVQRLSEEELARHPSLERRLSRASHR